MLKLKLLGLILCLTALKVPAQILSTESPEKLLLAIQKSKPDTNKIGLQLQLANYYFEKSGEYQSDLDTGLVFINQAIQLSNKLHNVDWQYKAQAMMAVYYTDTGDLARGSQYIMRAIAYYHLKGNISREAYYWGYLGDLNDIRNNAHTDVRVSYYQHARLLYLQNHEAVDAATMLSHIANIHISNKRFDLAEDELKQVFGPI